MTRLWALLLVLLMVWGVAPSLCGCVAACQLL